MLQSWRDHGQWRVRELLNYLARFYVPFSAPEMPRPWRVDELIEVIGLSELANAKLKTLSGGQQRRLDIAIGIVGRPEVVFLDEPTAGFDPHARREFHELMHQLSDLENTTILITTHDLDEAEKVADRIIVLDEGRIVADGTVEQLARQFRGRRRSALDLGRPPPRARRCAAATRPVSSETCSRKTRTSPSSRYAARASRTPTWLSFSARRRGPSRFARQPDTEQRTGTGDASEAQA